MNVQIDQLVKSLLEKDSLENCSLQEVKEYADRHPHFGAAQLLLTKKMQVENVSAYDEQLQKTILFFHNPLWVKKILNDTGDATVVEKKKEEPVETIKEKITEAPLIEIKEEEIVNIADSTSLPDETEETANSENDDSIELPTFKFEPIESSKSDLLFEPFHTVDYFASQGINFKEEEKPTDKFGKQLRSFTDWLKTMKRLPSVENSISEEPLANKKVEQMAEHSIQEKEILTIAMAEVWEKQGNKAKAIDIYTKLSLLDPSKSTYFAAKIEELKKKQIKMTTLFIILIVIASVALGLIVLVQNPKGGGLAGSIGGFSSQFMGVKQTNDVLEKGTWIFAGLVGALCMLSVFFISKSSSTVPDRTIDATGAPVPSTSQPLPSNTVPLTPTPAPTTPQTP